MRINPQNFEYVESDVIDPTTVDFSSATARDIYEDGVTLDIANHIIEQITANNQEPKTRFRVGRHVEGEFPVITSDLELLGKMLGVDVSSGSIQMSCGMDPKELGLHAVQFDYDIRNNTNGNTGESNIITGLNFIGDLTMDLGNEGWYLTMKIQSTSQSKLKISQS